MPEKVPVEAIARLALGAVQFGLRYGEANSSGRITPADIEATLLNAKRAGMDTLDTAVAYRESESALGSAGVSSWRVITKLPPLPGDVDDLAGWVAAHEP
jgi:aryl-alcohol dehydrogenase-like predicted oxidoreductase